MTASVIILIGLVLACPLVVFTAVPVTLGIYAILLGLGLWLAVLNLPPGEAAHLRKLIGFLSIPVLALAFWILIQMLPLPFLAHPFWQSAWNALHQNRLGSISIDTGATALALTNYLTLAGAALLTAVVTINRLRAQWILTGTAFVLGLIAFYAICLELLNWPFFIISREEALDCACLGTILCAACAALLLQARESGSSRRTDGSPLQLVSTGAVCGFTFAICALAILLTKSGSLIFATGCGLFIFCSLIFLRRLAIGRLSSAAIAVTALIIAVALVLSAVGRNSDPRLAFVKKTPAAIEMTELLLERTPILGNGAGTLASILPIYQTSADYTSSAGSETTAARISIEMGRPVLWIAVFAAFAGIWLLVRGALERGRDNFYPAAGAACLISLLILGFINSGISGPGIGLLSAVIFGLGLAQSMSRSAR